MLGTELMGTRVNVKISHFEYNWVKGQDGVIEMDEHPNLVRIYPADILCEPTGERQCMEIGPEGALYNSGRHLSILGARRIVEAMMVKLQQRNLL